MTRPAKARLTQCMTNLQDPTVLNHHGERHVTFSTGDSYSRYPIAVVRQSGGVYRDVRSLTADLRAVGGYVEHSGYRMTYLPKGIFCDGASEVFIEDTNPATRSERFPAFGESK